MDVDVDSMMDDADVLPSTESNGQVHTIDPSIIVAAATSISEVVVQVPGQAVSPSPPGSIATNAEENDDIDTSSSKFSSLSMSEEKADTIDEMVNKPRQRVEVVIPGPSKAALPYSSSCSGLVYDMRMRFHSEPSISRHEGDIHPEDPRRIVEIYDELVEAGLVPKSESSLPKNEYQLWRIKARQASCFEICLVHSSDHYKWVESLSCSLQAMSPLPPCSLIVRSEKR